MSLLMPAQLKDSGHDDDRISDHPFHRLSSDVTCWVIIDSLRGSCWPDAYTRDFFPTQCGSTDRADLA